MLRGVAPTPFQHRIVNGQEVKRCRECLQWLPIDRFKPYKTCRDGRDTICYGCRHERQKRHEATSTGVPVGCTVAEYLEYWQQQGGRCYLCGDVLPDEAGLVYVDKGHLLCFDCRLMLRAAHYDADLLYGAAMYIEKHQPSL